MPKSTQLPSPDQIREEDKKKEQQLEINGNAEVSRLTDRKRRLAQELLLNPTQPFTEAAKKAGYKLGPTSKASVIKREIAGKLKASLREMGIFESDLAKVVVEALNANNYKLVKVPVYHENGELKTYRYDVIETPDHPTRLAAFTKIALLGDYFPAQKLQIDERSVREHRIFSQVDVGILEDRAKQLRSKTKQLPSAYSVVEEENAAFAATTN